MKLKDYIKNLQKLVKNNPDAANWTVIYSKDDEGNGYSEVHFDPTIGNYTEGDFIREPNEDEGKEAKKDYLQEFGLSNSICVN